jgi:hypothetical protein
MNCPALKSFVAGREIYAGIIEGTNVSIHRNHCYGNRSALTVFIEGDGYLKTIPAGDVDITHDLFCQAVDQLQPK